MPSTYTGASAFWPGTSLYNPGRVIFIYELQISLKKRVRKHISKKLVPGLLVLSHRARNYAPALEVLDNLPPAAPHGLWIGDRETLVCDRWRSGSAIYEVNG